MLIKIKMHAGDGKSQHISVITLVVFHMHTCMFLGGAIFSRYISLVFKSKLDYFNGI